MDEGVELDPSKESAEESLGRKRQKSSSESETNPSIKKSKYGSDDVVSDFTTAMGPPASIVDTSQDIRTHTEEFDKKLKSGPACSKSVSGLTEQSAETKTKDVSRGETAMKNELVPTKSKEEKKKGKSRQKAVLAAVLEQMEFYFSDSNLSKDRFLSEIYASNKDGYVDLAVFGSFNKLQSLHKDGVSLALLCKALKKSTMLELNEDCTMVKRRTPVVKMNQEEINKRTVYVEYLPRHASHAWIQKMFSPCGKVCYVSLPTFKTTQEMKGFAFVEFETPEGAAKACQMLNNPPPTKTDEKPGKFPKGNKTLNRLQKIVPYKPPDEEENEENTDAGTKAKEEQDKLSSDIKKKKKKKTKKRRSSESASEDCLDKNEVKHVKSEEVKKKKKKKKKKHAASVDTSLASEEESTAKGGKIVSEKGEGETSREAQRSGDREIVKKDSVVEVSTDIGKDDMVVKEDKKESEEPSSKKKRKRKKKARADQEAEDIPVPREKTIKTGDKKKSDSTYPSKGKSNVIREASAKSVPQKHLSDRLKRKQERQADLRRKKEEWLKIEEGGDAASGITMETQSGTPATDPVNLKRKLESDVSDGSEFEGVPKVRRKSDGSELMSCLVKFKKQAVQKKVEFDPVPITTEFIKQKEVRKRKKVKRDSLHLRVITKEEWLSLKSEYIHKQKAHMSALKKSLRELRQEEQNRVSDAPRSTGNKHVDLTDVFGTKRLKPTLDIKLAHLEELKFRPNVIVQWKCSHEMSREKIRSMFKEISGEHIDYIEAQEEAKSGYIRFKDETSAETFTKLSRLSPSFSARVLPESQQASYWEKANKDRIAKLSRRRCERGTERIARKVFERNKARFLQKPLSHIVFDEDEGKEDGKDKAGAEKNEDADTKMEDKDVTVE